MYEITEALLHVRNFKKAYETRLSEVVAPFGLSRVEADVLLFLHNNPGYDTAHDVVELRGLAKSYVSKAVEGLAEKGLLAPEEDRTDRRVVHLTLLPASRAPLEAALGAQQAFLQVVYAGVTAEERETLGRVLRKIARNLEEAN